METREDDALRRSLAGGDRQALAQFFERQRARLHRMVSLRMDPRVQARVAPSDILQDTFLEAAERVDDLVKQPEMPPFLWVRFLALQKLIQAHRRHLGALQRDAGREVSMNRPAAGTEATSAVLAARLVGNISTPSRIAMHEELRRKIQEALDAMDPLDREVLALRHFEQLSSLETARVVGMEPSAASKRYIRALKKLGAILGPDMAEGAS